MHARRRVRIGRLVAALLAAAAFAAGAATTRAAEAPSLGEVVQAIVAIESHVAEEARTAATLGQMRAGSGVVVDEQGLVLTIGYLILEADEVTITVGEGRQVPARVVGYDSDTGFGLLRAAEPLEVRPIALGDSAGVSARDPVLVLTAGGMETAMPALVVARHNFAGYWEYLLDDAIVTVPSHPNYGGAALLGQGGELLGIGSLAMGVPGLGRPLRGNLFVPIDAAKPLLAQLRDEGRIHHVSRPWLGVYLQEAEGGLNVTRVAEEGPAETAGVVAGDVIVGIDGLAAGSLPEFYRTLWGRGDAGVSVRLALLRDDQVLELTVGTRDRYTWLRFPARD